VSLLAEIIAMAVGATIVDEVDEVIEDTLRSKPHRYYRKYWWLLVDDRDERAPGAVYRRRETRVWPPFMGHRVPLGGDRR
jgi:hypothetical protein